MMAVIICESKLSSELFVYRMLFVFISLIFPAESQNMTCRCLDSSFCRTTGLCLDYQCDRGWMGPPQCQTPCGYATFGSNCRFTCHCHDNKDCNKVSGSCSCEDGFGGASCQTKLPRLADPPWLDGITCNSTTVLWFAWSDTKDVGDPGLVINSYRIKGCINGTSPCSTANKQASGVKTEFVEFPLTDPWEYYEFRVVPLWWDYNKPTEGILGPWSSPVRPRDFCMAPLGPSNVTLTWSNETSLALEWTSRVLEFLEVIQYRIIYNIKGVGATPVKNYIHSGSNDTQFSINNLRPGTPYLVQIQAQVPLDVNDGWSLPSTPVTFTTKDGLPEAARSLIGTSRNKTCISVSWEPPLVTNGLLTGFNVTCQSIMPSSSLPTILFKKPLDLVATFRGLESATLYKITVIAYNRAHHGPSTSGEFWTLMVKPPPPPAPVVVKVTNHTVLLKLEPVAIRPDLHSGYYVAVEVSSNGTMARRSIELISDDPVMDLGLGGYTCAWLSRDDVLRQNYFLVGDGSIYGRFENRNLETGKYYIFYYVVSSSLNGDIEMSYSTSAPAVQTLSSVESSTLPMKIGIQSSDSLVPATVLSLLVLLLLVLLIILFYCCYWRKRYASEKEEQKVIIDEQAMIVLDNQWTKRWSDIWSLETSRYPLYSGDSENSGRSPQSASQPPISIEEEFELLPNDPMFACEVAKRTENRPKNRFEHILAYDHTRVKLRNNEGSDYINANYIFGNSRKVGKSYIASQSPFSPQTICDFWDMVYQRRISVVVFLSQLIEDNLVKCEQYWPEDAYIHKYGKILVSKKGSEKFSNFVIRKFEITSSADMAGAKSFVLKQYHFLSWKNGNNLLNILEFWRKIKFEETDNCWLVHCSTGSGRTGVFIAFDNLMRNCNKNKRVNVYLTCLSMRGCRPVMVRSSKHYNMIYDLLFEALQISYNEQFIDRGNMAKLFNGLKRFHSKSKQSILKEQFHLLEKFSQRPNEKFCSVGMGPQNKLKNRFSTPDLVPRDDDRVRLYKLEDSDHVGDSASQGYINAFFLDSFDERHFLIVTQTPLAETLADFWQMIYETNSSIIIDMNPMGFKDESCAVYIPQDFQKRFLVGKQFIVEIKGTEFGHEYFEIQRFVLICSSFDKEERREIVHFKFKSWKMFQHVPESRTSLLEFVMEVEKVRRLVGKTPLTIHCMDGAAQVGLVATCFILFKKLLSDGSVDVFHTIKYLKSKRYNFIKTHDQYSFCFKFLWEAMKILSDYETK